MKKKTKSQFAVAAKQFSRNKLAIVGLIILAIIVVSCLFADYLTPYDYDKADVLNKFAPISLEHPCGTDQFGRDILTRILKGGQISLLIAAIAVIVSACAGAFLGTTAAFFGGAYETVVMRLVDILMSIPSLLLACAVSTALGEGLSNSIFAIALANVANMTRVMYSSALTLKGQEYLEAARATGSSKLKIVFTCVLPNCIAPLIVQITMRLGVCITMIASLSFIGLGVRPPTPEWGSLLNAGKQFIRQYWPLVTFPGVAIALTLISVSFVGDGVRDALDPKLKR